MKLSGVLCKCEELTIEACMAKLYKHTYSVCEFTAQRVLKIGSSSA